MPIKIKIFHKTGDLLKRLNKLSIFVLIMDSQ